METHTNNNAYAKRITDCHHPHGDAFILVSGLEMTVSRCEIIISRFAITISHLEINFTMPSGNNPLAATTIPRNSTTIPRNSTIIPRNSTTIPHTTSGLGGITPMPLPCFTAIGGGCQLVIAATRADDGTHRPRQPLRGERKIGGGCNKIGHKYNKSGTDCVNNVYYII